MVSERYRSGQLGVLQGAGGTYVGVNSMHFCPDCTHLNIDWEALIYEKQVKCPAPESPDGVIIPQLVNWIIREVQCYEE